MSEPLKAPFPYFGGKSRAASIIWSRLGLIDNYCEPFFGSGAVLLSRPHPFDGVETVNDVDSYLANFWRATQYDPEAVASYADGPVNEVDLHARHRWLVLSDDAVAFRQRMRADPDYFDARVAGWWCWGLCCWIGSGWCTEPQSRKRPRANRAPGNSDGHGVMPGVLADPKSKIRIAAHNKGSVGKGVHAKGDLTQKIPNIDSRGMDASAITEGFSQQIPMLSAPGRVIHAATDGTGQSRKLPTLSGVGYGVDAIPDTTAGDLSQQVPRLTNDLALLAGPGHKLPKLEGYASGTMPEACGKILTITCAERHSWLLDWFTRLRDRLRNVRVCCGDWLRVCSSDSVTVRLGITGVFLDPPYPTHRKCGKKSRTVSLYSSDTDGDKSPEQIHEEILAWSIPRYPDRRLRICIAGYEGDGYEVLVAEHGWKEVAWKAVGGYGNRTDAGRANAARERLYFSPHCVFERTLFDAIPHEGDTSP